MFVSIGRYKNDTGDLAAQLREKNAVIEQLEVRARAAEKSRHHLVELMRYVLEAGATTLADIHPERREQIHAAAHALPYLLNGERRWGTGAPPEYAEQVRQTIVKLAAEHGFALPDDPVKAVEATLALVSMLFAPAHSVPVESLRRHYPCGPNCG